MDVLILIGILLLGGLFNFIKELDIRSASRLAGIYIFITVVAAIYSWIHYFVGSGDAELLKVLNVFLQILNGLAHTLLGYLTAYIMLDFQQSARHNENEGIKNVIRSTRRAISVSIASTFILAVAGKMQNLAFMLDFFRLSGYANRFLYFMISAELLGALAILLHYKFKTGRMAVWGLIMMMLGAVFTHLHKHDPFSDSFAAVIRLIDLSLLLLVYYFEKKAGTLHPVTPIYVV